MSIKFKIEWFVILGLIAYIVFLQQCGTKCPEYAVANMTVTERYTDTTYVYDSIPRYYNVPVPVPTPVPHPTDTSRTDSINEYTSAVSDSILTGEIISKVDGVLVEQSFKYTLLAPRIITIRDSIFVNNTEIFAKDENFLYLGAEIGVSPVLGTMNLSPKIGIGTKNGYMYEYRFGILDKTHNLGISKRFNLSKPRISLSPKFN